MRGLMNLLIILGVLWCGLQLSPAEAEECCIDHCAEAGLETSPDEGAGADREQSHATHLGHSHCPVAPEGGLAPALAVPVSTAAPLFARAIRALTSAPQAPPLEPPAA